MDVGGEREERIKEEGRRERREDMEEERWGEGGMIIREERTRWREEERE